MQKFGPHNVVDVCPPTTKKAQILKPLYGASNQGVPNVHFVLVQGSTGCTLANKRSHDEHSEPSSSEPYAALLLLLAENGHCLARVNGDGAVEVKTWPM